MISLFSILLGARLCAAETVVASTPTASRPAFRENPFTMSYLLAPNGKTSVRLDYRIRWDFDTFKRLPDNLEIVLRNPVRTLRRTGADIYDGATVGFYGMRLRPNRAWRPSFEEERPPGEGEAGGETVWAQSRRRRLSLTPIIEDLRRETLRGLQRGLITESVDYALPRLKSHSFDEKKSLVEDLDKTLEIWGLGE